MDAKSLLVCGLIASSSFVAADLRMASQPKGNYVVRQRNAVQFVSKTALYMEPSAFDYPGLITQREKAYDNFLRSNIDNEQDKRNFHNTVGRDMLPVRSFEGAETDASATVQNKIPANGPGPAITATPDQAYIVPLRWNNPHASELEVNVWISDMKYVVPIRKPTCSGEGRQDNVFAFTIPKDFNDLGKVVPGWTGCKKVGDCVLQIYAHSVEPRTYAIGTPLIVTGDVPAATATNTNGIQPAGQDPGLDLSKQPNEVCLSSASPLADITTAVPRQARLISDVANHAYQNSNYSPYSGQQPEAISKNLQAAVIISMIPANRGELGKALLKKENPAAAAFQKNLAAKAQNLVKQYEGVVNNIIAQIGDKQLKTTATLGEQNEQKLANSFRAAQVGSVTTTRLKTNTYIPSFQLETQDQIDAAKKLVPAAYKGLISSTGVVQLYQAVLNDLKGEFNKAASLGLEYMGPVYKPTAATLESPTKHRKLTAQGRRDQGEYATSLFKASQKAAPKQAAFAVEQTTLLSVLSSCSDAETCSYPDTDAEAMQDTHDMEAMNMDGGCDNDDAPADADCSVQGAPLFKLDADGNIEEVNANTATATIVNTLMLVATATLGALLWA